MPPVWVLVDRMEGRVSPTGCLAAAFTLGIAAVVLGGYYHPLPAMLMLFLVESLCCAASRTATRVYRLPRLVERLGSLSRLLEYMLLLVYYSRYSGPGAVAVLAASLIIIHAGVGEAEEEARRLDGLLALLMGVSAAILELHAVALLERGSIPGLMGAALIPVLGAAGLVAATLIYREATGV